MKLMYQKEVERTQSVLDQLFDALSLLVGKATACAILRSAIRTTQRHYPCTDQIDLTTGNLNIAPMVMSMQADLGDQWLEHFATCLQAITQQVEYILQKLTGRVMLNILAQPLQDVHMILNSLAKQ